MPPSGGARARDACSQPRARRPRIRQPCDSWADLVPLADVGERAIRRRQECVDGTGQPIFTPGDDSGDDEQRQPDHVVGLELVDLVEEVLASGGIKRSITHAAAFRTNPRLPPNSSGHGA